MSENSFKELYSSLIGYIFFIFPFISARIMDVMLLCKISAYDTLGYVRSLNRFMRLAILLFGLRGFSSPFDYVGFGHVALLYFIASVSAVAAIGLPLDLIFYFPVPLNVFGLILIVAFILTTLKLLPVIRVYESTYCSAAKRENEKSDKYW